MDTAGRGEVAMWEAQKASNTRLDYGAKVCLPRVTRSGRDHP